MAWQLAAGLVACALHCLLGASALHTDATASLQSNLKPEDDGPLIQKQDVLPDLSVWFPNTTTTATTTLEPAKIEISFSIEGLTLDALNQNASIKADLASVIAATIADKCGVPPHWVDVAFGGVSSFTAFTHLNKKTGIAVTATISVLDANTAFTPESINNELSSVGDLATQIVDAIKSVPNIGSVVTIGNLAVTQPVVNTNAPPAAVSSYGDPHCQNLHGKRFDIQQPGNHSFLVLPRGADNGQANLHVEARVTRRGGLCTGQLFVTSLKLAGRWIRKLGGDVELYAATEMFNSPQVVGLKLGNSSNMSIEEFVARVPKHTVEVFKFRPELPAKLNTHVNTLRLQFKVGPSTVKVGWSHEKLKDGFANWLWLGVSGLGTSDEAGGLLGSDDHSAVQMVPNDVLAACQKNTGTETRGQDAGLVDEPGAFRSWAIAEA